ncbi:Toxoplasma gondii family B protein [Toxoplasma gondii TgCatPRC2]|uniref:Toxoplasma gondii family B protein n=11 Tax=Toxoplasma gondii TaxID=5811 RepID=A0A125YXH7_TOXGV|nr:Toxoplasma gondii family B protein [Toxoplasma gondii ME49]EPR57796.1 Toxoplasma gondii family B protein [Toxoplasma gondii GT1]ESS29138.1 Toxoplasma gondii family B protein [Toxoplasma gondii VEG]KAF4646284.1 Toxoplasma gondii family B protein [Toxoplasma gondii]KFG35710.1 Toxoplasma gondii family B protein [Toxoplasma gondii FOU]KFG37061.1 Toxoplasma gondii family B protein [Toxoplasma gondii GAB2-2007-GAL-DOM2]KFH06077.1 Toxoplasma gondii family B protein [Toxoplasma gondii MAS]KYF3909|eukprot:XP_018638521.1 Toxoplasma gondii family B protein [Toxoplasma gondii ME49]
MILKISSANVLVFVIIWLCAARSCCIESLEVATSAVDSAAAIHSGDNGSDAAFMVPNPVAMTNAQHQRMQLLGLLNKSRRSSPAKKKTVARRRTKEKNVAAGLLLLTVIFGILLAFVKLQHCRQKLLKSASGATEGNTTRRLAEDNCVRLDPARYLYL